jgi:hypothetical protein
MEGIIGLILGAGGGWAAWWAFHQAAGFAAHGWFRPVSIIVGVIGVILIFDFIRRWWIED